MLCVSDVYTLIDYAAFIESMFIMLSVLGLLWLRYKEPNLHRPIKVYNRNFRVEFYYYLIFIFWKVSLFIPIVFIMICCFLVFIPIYVRPREVAAGLLITATGIPAYFIGIYWENKPECLKLLSSMLQFRIFHTFPFFTDLFFHFRESHMRSAKTYYVS